MPGELHGANGAAQVPPAPLACPEIPFAATRSSPGALAPAACTVFVFSKIVSPAGETGRSNHHKVKPYGVLNGRQQVLRARGHPPGAPGCLCNGFKVGGFG